VSRAALFGGTTSILDFAIQYPGIDLAQAIQERTSVWQGNSYADYSHHLMLLGEIPDPILGQLREHIADGFASVKIFTTNIRPPTMSGEPRMVRMGHLHDLMEQIQRHNAMLLVHSEDDDMVQHMYQKLAREERTEWWNMHHVHSNESEDVSFRRVLRVAEWTGSPVYFVHVSARQGLDAIREARAQGRPVYGETLHNYCCFNAENYREENGMKYHTYPSLKSEEDRLALWDGVVQGGINTMATDEYCTSWEVKIEGKLISDVTGGHNGIETRLGITYSEGVSRRGMSLQRFVDVTSTNAARIMGLYPRKGIIAPGSDADIVLIDPSIKRPLTMNDFHITDYSIWEGYPVAGWPVLTILRGTVAVENGQLQTHQGHGQFLKRKVDPAVANRPAC
jgi:dihydropyrimidinase